MCVSEPWFYNWRNRTATLTALRRRDLDKAVLAAFVASGGTYGSPRVADELRGDAWAISTNTVAAVMARQGLSARPKRRARRALRRPEAAAAPPVDLLRRDFTAPAPNHKWVGDFKQVPTGEGPVHLATVVDLYSRRLVGFALSDTHPTAQLAGDAIRMATAIRGGDIAGVIFHTDRCPTKRVEPVIMVGWRAPHFGGVRRDGRCLRIPGF
jgi:transposase InsO family protein